jgi:hypothetical protein
MNQSNLDLIKHTYQQLSNEEITNIIINEKASLSHDAQNVIESELSDRNIDIEKVVNTLSLNDEELFSLYINSGYDLDCNTGSFIQKKVEDRIKNHIKKYSNNSHLSIIEKIRSHKIGKEVIPQSEYYALIIYLKGQKLNYSEEIWMENIVSGKEEEIATLDFNDFSKQNVKKHENSGIQKINEAGESIRKIGEILLFFFLGITFFIIGTIITGKLNPLLYLLVGIAEIVLVIRVISGFYEAGNHLKSIRKDDFK